MEDRVIAIEVKSIATKAVVGVTKEEATQVIVWYKASPEFEDKVSEAVCSTFFKSFEECKKKVAQVFNISDLHDIIIDEAEGARSKTDPSVRVNPAEAAEPKADPAPPQASSVVEATASPVKPCLVRETVVRVMAETRALIDTTMEAFKSGEIPAPNSGP